MDFTPKEIEQMAAGMRQSIEPPATPEESADALLTQIERIVRMENGHADQLTARYAPDFMAVVYNGHEFAHYAKELDKELWIEFEMYPALKQKYETDPRFANVADKDALYWRVYLRQPEDIQQYRDVIADETL